MAAGRVVAPHEGAVDFVGVGVPDDPKNTTSSVYPSGSHLPLKGKALRRDEGIAPYGGGTEIERGAIPVAPNRRQKAAAS